MTFSKHEIVSHTLTPDFGSWLLKRRHSDGGWDYTFWTRITASEGLLTVTGDFYPTTFSYGPKDPVSCVYWIGSFQAVDSYVAEKARRGSGDISEYSTEWAFEDLREMLREEQERLSEDDEDAETESNEIAAIEAGLDVLPSYNGILGCHEILLAVLEEYKGGDLDGFLGPRIPGERLSSSVHLALQALNRLVELLGGVA